MIAEPNVGMMGGWRTDGEGTSSFYIRCWFMLELTCQGLYMSFGRIGRQGVDERWCNDVAEKTNT